VFQTHDSADGKEKKGAQKLLVTSGEDVKLVGTCIYFFRITNDKEVLDKFMDRVSCSILSIASKFRLSRGKGLRVISR